MARRAREEAPGEDREVPGRRRHTGDFSVVAKFCADFLLNSQLTPQNQQLTAMIIHLSQLQKKKASDRLMDFLFIFYSLSARSTFCNVHVNPKIQRG